MIFQRIPQLQVDAELGSEFVAIVLSGVAQHHSDGVILLLVRTNKARYCIRIAIGVAIEVVLRILVNQSLTLGTVQRDRQRGR